MSDREEVNRLISPLSSILGVDDVALDEQGQAAFQLQESIIFKIEVTRDGEALALVADLGPLPDRHSAPILRRCMARHYLGLQTAGATFALTPDGNRLVLCRMIPIGNMSPEAFAAIAEAFLKVALDPAFSPNDSAPRNAEDFALGDERLRALMGKV